MLITLLRDIAQPALNAQTSLFLFGFFLRETLVFYLDPFTSSTANVKTSVHFYDCKIFRFLYIYYFYNNCCLLYFAVI